MVRTRRGATTTSSPNRSYSKKKKKASPKKLKKSSSKAKNTKKKISKKKTVKISKKQSKSISKKENVKRKIKSPKSRRQQRVKATTTTTSKKSPKKKSIKKEIVKKKRGSKQLKLSSTIKKKSKITAIRANQLVFPKIPVNHRFQFDFKSNHFTSEEYYILSEIYDKKIGIPKIEDRNKNILLLIGTLTTKSNLTEKIKNEITHFLSNSYNYEEDWPFLEKDDIYIKSRFLDAMYVIKEADYFEQNPNHEAMKEMKKMLQEDFGNLLDNDPTQYFFV